MDEFDKKIKNVLSKNLTEPDDLEQKIRYAIYTKQPKKKSTISFIKTLSTSCACIILSTGIVFAGYTIYDKIWKKPEEYSTYQDFQENAELKILNEKAKSAVEIEKAEKNNKIISESEAIDIANNISKNLGNDFLFNEEHIRYNEPDSQQSTDLYYVIRSSNNPGNGIEVKLSADGHLYSFVNYDYALDYNINTNTLNEEEIKNKLDELLIELNLNDKYTIIKIDEIENYNGNNQKKEYWAHYIRDYSGITNSYDNIDFYFYIINNELKIEKILTTIPTLDIDNNDIVIEEKDAINIAKNKDRELSELAIDKIDVKLEYRPLNSFYYIQEKSNGIEDGLVIEKQEDGTNIGYNKFSIENNVLRKVYNVKISYIINYTDEEPIHNWKEQFGREYYVDGTTGEIIGGRWGNNLD